MTRRTNAGEDEEDAGIDGKVEAEWVGGFEAEEWGVMAGSGWEDEAIDGMFRLRVC